MTENILSVEHLSFQYDEQPVLKDINLSIQKGEFAGLIGPNGSGKTTLIKLILGLEKIQTGQIHLFGTPLEKFKQWHKIGFVSQKANTFNRGFPATVYETVAMGLTGKLGYFRFLKKKDQANVYEALSNVGMEKFAERNIGDLSGGQQQRVFIARALVSSPEFLILDEPTVGVDTDNVERFYKMLADLNQNQGITLLLISHDIGSITTHVTDLLCLNKTIHYHGNPNNYQNMTDEQKSQFYGHSMNTVTHHHS
ncbi:zinc transport system ATP-binding protein [Melghiribacillus thermohalophilus]|uniref:Zinc transport system ATP-binding protein n=1 Tax=Melghiribacillus thermohalophilus TaxID=1324956 RepID=A0A4R3MM07_9BACI|nr:metal ABC transporter ATP-binding protein [Melghiribacillus thermohalophilus]TCT15969.1 zinc transport system ATP-binding protein [Melghiribacillus thermohalophilus]